MFLNFAQNLLATLICLTFSSSYPINPPNSPQANTPVSSASTGGPKNITTGTYDTFIAKSKRKRRRRGCNRSASTSYKRMKRNWQKVPKIKDPKWKSGYRDLTLFAVNLGERIRVFPFTETGEMDPEAVQKIELAFADKHTKATHSIDPRLIKLLYKLAIRFKAKQINIISGYREESRGRESHHANGTAVDIMIPGVKLPALAKVTRRLGHVGVGYYPSSGFVHLDVREKSSYFWVDPSGPGKSSCVRQIMKNHARKFDRQWKATMDEPEQKTNRKGELMDSFEQRSQNASADITQSI